MKKKKWLILLGLVVIVIVAVVVIKGRGGKGSGEVTEEITPSIGDIEVYISTTGTVEPQNRLEVKPAIGGRVEEILVREGDMVKAGQVLAWMSSIERATLLDAARTKDEETLRYWEEAYKASPLIAPIDGEVIVRAVEPGQTVNTNDPVIVLSDRLIVQAQVDETDIGKVKAGQSAIVSLDAYPEVHIKSKVDHIAYESKVVSNVTIYEVDILPERIPEVFRSGMSANVEIIERERKGVLTIPEPAVKRKKGRAFVLISEGKGREPRRQPVELGISDGNRVEVLSGLGESDRIIVNSEVYQPAKENGGGSPFSPWSRRRSRKK